jgi:PTH1 family peptidyl-tRNA hydrolase
MDEAAPGRKVIVGLGNPGPKYVGTRHNVGFDVLDSLSNRLGADAPRLKFDGKVAVCHRDNTNLVLVWPLTYMNRSGRCVSAVTQFYKVNIETDLLVVCDDLSLPLGKIRLRAKGSAGGQKGLNDILRALGSQAVPRLRIGIDSAPPQWDPADYVLSRFRKDEQEAVEAAIDTACEALLSWCTHDLSYCMNKFN